MTFYVFDLFRAIVIFIVCKESVFVSEIVIFVLSFSSVLSLSALLGQKDS